MNKNVKNNNKFSRKKKMENKIELTNKDEIKISSDETIKKTSASSLDTAAVIIENDKEIKTKGSSINLSSLFNEHSSTNTNLYVCNIPEKWNIKELENLFNQHGKVVSCRIMYDKYTGQSRRIGFVKFDTRLQSDDALKCLNGKIPKLSTTTGQPQPDKALIVKYANNSNYLSILTSIAADIAAVHGINPNEILSYISQLYFPLGSAAPQVCKQRKNLAEIIETKLKSYFGCEGSELFKNELKSVVIRKKI
jgi:RNA recognition motif-containing protein